MPMLERGQDISQCVLCCNTHWDISCLLSNLGSNISPHVRTYQEDMSDMSSDMSYVMSFEASGGHVFCRHFQLRSE